MFFRRVRRPKPYFWAGSLRLGVAGCFTWTSLVLPLAHAHAQDRSLSFRYQHNEFATSPEDSAYFSPQRLRERMGKMEDWIQNQNARLAHLQGRGDFGASEEFSDQVRRYSVERFFVQGEMNDELEAKRAQTSRQLAQAGGFRFKQYKDGKREWFKNGKVQRVENEKIVQNGRELRRETLDMTYDARGNLAGYRTETRDETGRVMGTSRWEGVYSAGRRQDARQLSFTENSWDALGNGTRLDRTNIKWTDDGKKTLSYTDKETDAYGQVTQRDVSDSTYNSDGLITSYKEVSLSSTGETSTKIWSDGTYEKNATDEWSLQSYKETVKDANGLQTAKEWGQAKYDDKGRLASFTEKNTSTSGKTSTRQWEKGRYDDQGQLTSYQEKVTDETGRTSFRGWEGGRYDENGRLVSYEERAVDRDGAASWRSWENGEYNAKNEMIDFTERSIDARGQPNVRVWQGKGYERGLLTHSNETNTDQRGRTSTKDWAGVYGEKDRLASFVETAIDVAGQTSSRAQDVLTYDALGRMTNYNETNLDSFGVESRQVWTASSFDEEDRVTGYESREITAAGEQLRRRKNISHTESGRIAGYDEELEVPGAGETPLLTLSHWSDAVYSPMGDLLSYRESTTNPVGETSSHLWSARYDSLGRTVSYVDERIGAAGPPVTVSWSASAFDAFDHATALTETMETDGAARVRTWSGAYDSRGLVMNSLETVRAPDGQTVATHLTSAAYDKKGRLTDSSTRVRRSDMPDLISETQVAGQTYDDAGRVTGGSDVTHLTGRTPWGAIDVTITGGTANSSVANGKLTGFEQTKIILGTDDRGQAVHIQDVTAVTLGQHGDRTDVTHHMAFNAQNQVVANKITTNRQTQTVQDAQGRTLTATQATFDNGTPEAVTTAQIKNTYGATGDIALSIEDATDALGVRTVRTNESLGTDVAGRTSANRTTLTRPGMTVTEEVTEQSQMTYDALGRSSTAHEDFTTTGPGLFTYSSLDRTITYDGSGNVRMTRETGERNGAEFENILTNNAFDISGRATAYHEQGWSADGGMTDTRRTDIHYNKYGQTNSYKDEGIVGGQYRLNIHTALERDAYGREIKSSEEGMSEGGRYRYESRTPSYNSLGQAIMRSESGWRAGEGNYSQTQTNIRYDVAGRQLAYDQTKTLESKTTVSHWASKGYDSQGASLGYMETGSITAGEGVGQVYTDEQAVGATNRLGQAVSYVTISAKTYTDGSTQTSTVNWSNGAYDNAGRLDGFFEDTTTVSVDADGNTKTARNARERHHTTRYDGAVAPNTDGGTAINGFTSGYTETLYKDGDPSKAERVEVTKMVYDQNGLFYESNTLRGKTDRFKDALRGLSSMLFGTEGPLSKTGQALAHLFALTEGLMERVGNWFEEAVAGGRDIVNRLLGLPTGSPTDNKSDRISAATLSTLTDALRKEIGTNQLYALPENLRPAVQSFGAMDEPPLLTRRTATVYDAQGRTMNWKEYSLTAASPAKPIYSEVNVTYKGTSSQLASYDAKTIEGEKVLHTYRDQFTHDDQGRESYREVNFEGEDIKLLPSLEEGEAIPSDNSSDGILSGWSHLTSDQRSTLLDNIYNEDVEVLGKVDFFIPDLTEYDATGAIENQFTTHVTRGIELFSLVDQFDLAQEAQQAEVDTALAIEAENQTRLGAQNEIINNINGKITQNEENIVASQGAVDKQNDVLEKAISEEKSTQDQMDALKGQVGDITFKIDAYLGKELSRALISVGKPPVGFVSPGRVSSREFYDNKIRMKETIFFGWYSVVQINSAGQFVESVVCAEKKVLSSFSSNKNGKWSWNEVSQSSKDISSKDINILFSINDDEKANTFLWNKLAKHFLSIRKVDISSPVFKALFNLYSDRIKTNANIEKLKPELKSKSETTQKEQSVFNAIYGSLQTLQSQLEADNGSLIIAQNDLETLITYLANDKALKMAEARAETDRLVQVLSGNLGANGVLADGRTINFSVSDWETLLKGETVTQGGKQWNRDSFSANAFGKRSLNSAEHTARLAMNRAGQTQTLAWKGTMTLDGQVVDGKNSGLLKQIATLAENASSQGPPNSTASLPGLSFNGDGYLSVTPPPTQTLDGFGRLTSQTSKTYSVSRWNGETADTVVTQSMKDFRYDTQGHVIGYDRVTSEPGKNPTREVLESATYDAQGRQRASVTRIIDESGSYKIQMSNDGYDANGRPLNTQRVKTQGTSVTVSKEIGIPLIDEWGHTLFGASENLSTTVDNWSNKPDFNKAVGQRSKGYTWNTAFNANGDVIDSFRIAQKAFGQEGSHLVYESTHSTYKPASAGPEAGRVAASVSKVVEVGRDAKTGATLFKSYADENSVTKYSANGQALFQTTVHSENGVTTKTEDNAARIYDGSGRLTETSTTTTDPSGQKNQNHFKATAFDQAGRATAFERSSGRDGITTFSEKVSGAVYDVNGNLVGQDAKISEWDEDGKEVKNSTKTERGNTYNLFGQLTKSVSTTTHIDSHGATITDTKETKYAFDLSGRVVKTTVNGQEIKNGAIKPYNSIQEILSWDKNGRAARTRNSSVLDGVTTEKISLQDIQYDSKGRVISGRDLVHKTGGKLSQYTEDAMDVSAFDSWGRAAKYTQSLVDGGLRTQSSISLTYDADGLVTSQTTNVLETSINALVNHHVERTIKQAGMKYDALGNLVDYKKEVKEGDLTTTYKPLSLEYDQFGRPTTVLERVTDTTGRDDIVGQLGSKYNSLGQLIESPGQSVTVKGTSKALDNLGNLEKVVAGIKAGAFRVDHDAEGKRLVESLGFTGVWVNQTTEPIGYDLQGRANKTYTVMNKVGWGTIDVPVTEVLFDQTVDRQDGHKYAASLEQRKQELQARGLDVTGTTFVWEGNTKKHRYCRATITYNKKVDVVISTQEVSNVDVKVFDALNRPLVQTVGTSLGGNTTTNNQFLTYNSKGQVAAINSTVTEVGKNADGGQLNRTYSQKQTFTYNTLGQSTQESTQTWGDSQAPLKITTSVVGDIKYGAKGERLAWVETTSTNDSTVTDVRRMSGATYDGLGRLSTYNAVAYERIGGVDKLKYVDRNVVNTYDNKGRLSRSVSRREWGDKVNTALLSAEEAQKANAAAGKSGQPGGGVVAGLDEGWTSGSAVVVTTYQYSANGTSISGMKVTAEGTGTNTNGEVQAQGIHLSYEQSNIKYDSVGRATSYHLKTTQIEHYDYYTQVQKGLKRKNAKKSVTEAVTTESDVQVLEFDGFGRAVHTVVESNRSDKGKTWTYTDTKVKSFDEQGRAKDVDRQTQSKVTVVKKKGSLGMKIAAIATMFVAPIVGAAMLASTSLGGQVINSYSHTVVQNQYKADGTLDEEATKAKTTTLEEETYQQGKNFGDKTMQVVDIAVAVGAVVAAVVLMIVPGTQALAGFCIAAAAAMYAVARNGISTHDLGMFGENHDRAEGKHNAMVFCSSVVTVAVAGAAAWMSAPSTVATGASGAGSVASTANTVAVGAKTLSTASGAAQLSRTARTILTGIRVVGQMAAAKAGGASSKTIWKVAALSVTSSLLNGGDTGGIGGTMTKIQGAFAIAGSLVTNVGLTYGKQSQRTTWLVAGSGLSGAGGEPGAIPTSALKTYAMELYAKKNDGSGGLDQDKLNQGLITQAVGEAVGSALGRGVKLYGDRQIELKAAALGITPAHYQELAAKQPIPKHTVKSFMIDLGAGLLSPLKALAGFVMALRPAADRSNAMAAQREAGIQAGLRAGIGEPTTVFETENGARVTCAVDGSGQPVFVKGSVLEFKNTRMSVENQDYLSGRFVSDGAHWQLDGEGLMVANHFKGLSREDGGNLPVTVMGRGGAVEHLGVDWTLVPVGMAMKVSNIPTRLNGIGIVYAGTFNHAGDGQAVWEAGSLYQGEGDTRPTMVYSDRGKVSLLNVEEVKGNTFVVQVKNVGLGDGSALNFDNVRIPGRIENGVGVLTTDNVQGTAHLVGQFGEASGFVNVRAGADGFELVGTLKGNVALREREDRAVSADRPSGAGRELPAGQFTVMGKSGGYYHLLGEKIPVTEGGIEPFTANTEFNVAAGAYLRKGPLDYRQNESKGFFKVMGDGTIVAPYKSAVRDFTAHTLSVMGVDGNAESVVRFNNLWQPISGKTAGGMSEGVKPTERDGKKVWLIEGLGQHDIFVEMTPQERAGNGRAVRGLTTLERYAKKAMVFGLAYVSPVPLPEKSAAVLVESSAHTSTTLAGNLMGLGRNGVILLGIGSNQLGEELLGKSWESHVQERLMRVFGWVAENLDSAKISMELINTDRLVGLGGAARDNQLTIGQVGGAMAIGSLGDLVSGFVTMSPLGGKSMDHYKKAYSGNAWSVTKAAIKDIVEPIYESITYASSNGSNPADRGVVAKFYGLGEGEAQRNPMDIYGPEVTMGLAVGNTITVGLMTGALLYGGLKGGVKVFNEEVGVAGNSYGRLSVVRRVGKATVRAGFEVGKEVAVQAADQIVPGVAGKAVHFAERRTTALKVLEFRQIEKNLAISDMAGVNVYDRIGNKVILEIHGRDGQMPDLPELARRLGESTKGSPIEIQIGFRDPAMVETVSGNRDLLNLFDKNGIKNVRDLAKFERGVAVQRRELYERVEKEYKGLAQVKEQAVLKLDGAIADGRVRLAELTELRDNRGRMGDDAFIAKVKSLVGDWDSAGADPGSPGGLSGRETNQRPNSEGLGRPGEEVRPGPEGLGGDRTETGKIREGSDLFQERAKARYEAERAKHEAERALNSEISKLEGKNDKLIQERSGLQQEISVFNGRAERAGAGTRRYGERVQRIDEHLQFLEERLKYLADPAVAKNLKITVTSAWREGAVRTRGFLDGWAQDRKAQPLDATYAPNPYTKIPKGNFLIDFLAEHPEVRELHESHQNQGLSPPESVVLVTVRENLAGAESLVRGIDPWRLKGEGNRFDQAVYFAEELWTGLLETIGEKGSPSHAAQFEFNVGEARILDLRNETLAAEFGYKPEKWTGLSQDEVYQKTHEVHHRARMAGYDAIAYESTKNPGHTSYAVIDHFDTLLKPASESIRQVDPSLLGAARQRLVAVLSDQSGKVLIPVKPTGSFFKSLFEKRNTAKPETKSPNVNTDGPPIVTPKTEATLSGSQNELSGPVVKPIFRSTPIQSDLNPREVSGFDQHILEKNYKQILPEDYLKLETTIKSLERVDTTMKDPATGATFQRMADGKTGGSVDIDGKGNVIRINAPAAPRSDTPTLNKSNAPRAGLAESLTPDSPKAQNTALHVDEPAPPTVKTRSPFEPTDQKLLTGPKKVLQLEYKSKPAGLLEYKPSPTPSFLPPLEHMQSPSFEWEYGPMRPGPLPENPRSTFWNGKYTEGVVPPGASMKIWKAGDGNSPSGSYFAFEPPVSQVKVRIDSAVKGIWVDPKTGKYRGNSVLNSVISVELNPGDKFFYGPIGNQGGVHLGGMDRIQIYVPDAKNVLMGRYKVEYPLQ